MKRLLLTLLLPLSLGLTPFAKAETVKIATCGAMKGYSYFWPGPFIPETDVGFGEDGISSGKTTLAIIDGKPDVISGDWGDPTTARLGGAEVAAYTDDENQEFIIFLVVYPEATIELYTYNLSEQSMVMLQTKFGGLTKKTAMFKSDCHSLY